MSTLCIGDSERPLAVADRPWIDRAFAAQARDGHAPCVRILIRTASVDLTLQTPNCAAVTPGERRPANGQELEVLRLWNSEGLSSARYSAAQVAQFVERVRQLL